MNVRHVEIADRAALILERAGFVVDVLPTTRNVDIGVSKGGHEIHQRWPRPELERLAFSFGPLDLASKLATRFYATAPSKE